MRTLLLLFVAGGTGCSFRYLTCAGVANLLGAPSPMATLAVNAAGCLLIGLLGHLTQHEGLVARDETFVLGEVTDKTDEEHPAAFTARVAMGEGARRLAIPVQVR